MESVTHPTRRLVTTRSSVGGGNLPKKPPDVFSHRYIARIPTSPNEMDLWTPKSRGPLGLLSGRNMLARAISRTWLQGPLSLAGLSDETAPLPSALIFF